MMERLSSEDDQKHYAYCMNSAAPMGHGDTKSWFEYYKLNCDDEAYVPSSEPVEEVIRPNDMLWFVMDGMVIGFVRILRVVRDEINALNELWFDAREIQRSPPKHLLHLEWISWIESTRYPPGQKKEEKESTPS